MQLYKLALINTEWRLFKLYHNTEMGDACINAHRPTSAKYHSHIHPCYSLIEYITHILWLGSSVISMSWLSCRTVASWKIWVDCLSTNLKYSMELVLLLVLTKNKKCIIAWWHSSQSLTSKWLRFCRKKIP